MPVAWLGALVLALLSAMGGSHAVADVVDAAVHNSTCDPFGGLAVLPGCVACAWRGSADATACAGRKPQPSALRIVVPLR